MNARRWRVRLATTAVVLAVLSLALVLAGCTPAPATDPGENAGYLRAHVVELPDGRTVTCVTGASVQSGIDCDWGSTE